MINQIIWIKNGLVAALRWAVIALFALLLAVVVAGVASRFLASFSVWLAQRGVDVGALLPRGQIRWSEEAAIYLLLWSSMLGSAAAFGAKGHLGVDYLVGKLHPDAQRIAEIIAYIVSGVFAMVVMVGGGIVLSRETLQAGQRSAAMNLPVGWLYAAVPLAGLFFSLFAIERLIEIFWIKKTNKVDNGNAV